MWLTYALGLFVALYALISGDDIFLDEHCKDKPDGNYDVGCRAFIVCTNGSAHQEFCLNGEVYNSKTGQCDDPKNAPKPCGVQMDCTTHPDGRFPDYDVVPKCSTYYTCHMGQFLGHNKCPIGLVFNHTNGICDWPYDVYPPCGTKPKP